MKHLQALLVTTFAAATLCVSCEKPPPEPPSPEHEACLTRAEAYFECKEGQAAQAGPAEEQILRRVKAHRRTANISAQKCENVLAKVDADDPCAP